MAFKRFKNEELEKEKPFVQMLMSHTGKDELKHFAVKLQLENETIAKARATSKKKAEEKASKRAFFALQKQIPRGATV